jgi:hypothetical protein
MSIVRVGLAETKKFAEGYEAIFTKKKTKSGRKKTHSAGKAGAKKKKKTAQKK